MKPYDILKLAVRLLGLVFLYQGLQALPGGVLQFCGAISDRNFERLFMSFAMVGWPLLVACWLLRGARLIMRVAYPDAVGPTESGRQIGGAIEKKGDA